MRVGPGCVAFVLPISAVFSPAPLAAAHANNGTPIDLLRTAYGNVSKDQWGGKTDPVEVDLAPAKLTQNWFTSKFIVALRRDAKCGENSIATSVWYRGQDHNIKNLEIDKINESSSQQVVRAKFNNNNGPVERHDFTFARSGNLWRIDDVKVNGRDLYATMIKGCVK
jgi:hypothetical protein